MLSLTGDGADDTQTVYEAVMGRCPYHSCLKECPNMQRRSLCVLQCSCRRMPAFGPKDVESVESLPAAKLGGDENELHQTTGRAGHVQNF